MKLEEHLSILLPNKDSPSKAFPHLPEAGGDLSGELY